MSPTLVLFVATGLALSIGWGIRGNFGHEFGALLPGALASLTAVLASGRRDWQPRVLWAGFLGAVGWSWGGSISYMQVIAYTHSGHSGTIVYGFACLFVIGFLWAAPGGAGLGIALEAPRSKLLEIPPMLALLGIVWTAQSVVEARLGHDPDFRHEDLLYWYDTDWLAAVTALLVACGRRLWLRRWDTGSSMVACAALGWWAGFLVLVNLMGMRMTPPRGDNWAGCLGLVIALGFWLRAQGWRGSWLALVLTGSAGGAAFAGATLLQLMELKSGAQTSWHSILEQTYGFGNGLGVAWAIHRLRHRLAPPDETGPAGRYWHLAAAAFLLVGIPWLNLQKNPEQWIKSGAVPATLHALPLAGWFHAAMALLLGLVLYLGCRHLRQPLAIAPATWTGRGQWVLIALLAFMVAGNFMRALPGFQAQRLVTEGVIQFNTLLLTALILGATFPALTTPTPFDWTRELRRAGLWAVGLALAMTLLPWTLVRELYGDHPVGFHNLHIRFGPDANATTAKPKAGQPHP